MWGEGFLLVEVLVYVFNLNNFGVLLSDVIIGYDIRDSCFSFVLVLREVFDIFVVEKYGMFVGNCFVMYIGESCGVIVVVGLDFLSSMMVISGLLSVYGIF